MQRVLIDEVLKRIKAELPQFKTVDVYNNQFFKQDDGTIDSFSFPAIFLSFPEGAEYSLFTAGIQQAPEITVRFYIADKLTKSRTSISKTVLEIMDLKQEVYKVFQGWSSQPIGAFSRIAEQTDEDRRNYYTFIQDYKTKIIDSDNTICKGTQVTLEADLTTELIINPDTKTDGKGIRTARDVNDN